MHMTVVEAPRCTHLLVGNPTRTVRVTRNAFVSACVCHCHCGLRPCGFICLMCDCSFQRDHWHELDPFSYISPVALLLVHWRFTHMQIPRLARMCVCVSMCLCLRIGSTQSNFLRGLCSCDHVLRASWLTQSHAVGHILPGKSATHKESV